MGTNRCPTQGCHRKAGPTLSTLNLCLAPPAQRWDGQGCPKDGQTCALEARSFRGGRKIRMGTNKPPPECFCCSFPFHADHSVVNRTSLLATVCICSFSKNFSPHLSRAGWCRGIWKRSLCLLLASSPGVQLQSDTMSSRHFGTIPWGQKRVKACFLEGMHTSPWLCFTSPCWLWLKVLRHGYVSIMIPQLAETDTGSSSVVTCSVLHAAGLPWNLQVLIVIQLSLRFNTQVTLVLTQKNDRLSCCNLEVGQED